MKWWNGGIFSSSSLTCKSQLLLFSRWISSRQSSTKLFVGDLSLSFKFLSGMKLNQFSIYYHGISNNIWGQGLSYDTNETVLRDAFERHGEIIEVKVICHRVSGKSQGYGFVQFTSENAASKALEEMNDKLLDGRNIRVHYALER